VSALHFWKCLDWSTRGEQLSSEAFALLHRTTHFCCDCLKQAALNARNWQLAE
jgi:hypothetical protein